MIHKLKEGCKPKYGISIWEGKRGISLFIPTWITTFSLFYCIENINIYTGRKLLILSVYLALNPFRYGFKIVKKAYSATKCLDQVDLMASNYTNKDIVDIKNMDCVSSL